MIQLTPLALASCHSFIREQRGTAVNQEQLEAMVGESLSSLLKLIDDQPWLVSADTHLFNAVEARRGETVTYLVLHARRQPDDDWLVGTSEEHPVTEEYMKRRARSEAEIIRRLIP